jgi:hypothetical protein
MIPGVLLGVSGLKRSARFRGVVAGKVDHKNIVAHTSKLGQGSFCENFRLLESSAAELFQGGSAPGNPLQAAARERFGPPNYRCKIFSVGADRNAKRIVRELAVGERRRFELFEKVRPPNFFVACRMLAFSLKKL